MEAEADEEAGLLNNEALATSSPERAPPFNQQQASTDHVAKSSDTARRSKTPVAKKTSSKAPSKPSIPQKLGTQSATGNLARPSKKTLKNATIPSSSKRGRGDEYDVDSAQTRRITPLGRHRTKRTSDAGGGRVSNTKKKRTAARSDDAAAEDSDQESDQAPASQRQSEQGTQAHLAEKKWMVLSRLQLWQDIENEAENVEIASRARSDLARQLNEALRDTTRQYKEIRASADDVPKKEDLEAQLPAMTQKVQKVMSKLRRVEPSECSEQLVLDVYTKSIPRLVRLLTRAMECRVNDRSAEVPYTFIHLEEITDIQAVLLSLLQISTGWDRDPNADRPVVRHIKQRLLPYVQRLHRHFKQALEEERVQERLLSNYEQYGRQHQDLGSSEEDGSRAGDEVDPLEAMMDDIGRERASFSQRTRPRLLTRSQILSPSPPKRRKQDESGWTQDEDFALCDELLNDLGSRSLPPEQRYIEILNSPVLQEKYIGQIRERALFMKPGLIEATTDSKGRVPSFVLSIE